MAGVFISYRRDDSQGFAGRLADDLSERFGEALVFRDVEIVPGEDFTEVLRQAIGSCDVLLAIINRRWLQARDAEGQLRLSQPDDWVRMEIEAALERAVRVIPVLVGGAEMPRPSDLPSSLEPLSRRQAFVLSDRRWAQDVASLAESIAARMSVNPVRPTPAPVETAAGALRELGTRVLEEIRRSRPYSAPPRKGGRLWPAVGRPLARFIGRAVKVAVILGLGYYLVSRYGDPSTRRALQGLMDQVTTLLRSL